MQPTKFEVSPNADGSFEVSVTYAETPVRRVTMQADLEAVQRKLRNSFEPPMERARARR